MNISSQKRTYHEGYFGMTYKEVFRLIWEKVKYGEVLMSLLQPRAILYVMMQREGETQDPPYHLYQSNYRFRIALREANFNHSGIAEEGKPRTAQIRVIQKFIGRLKTDNKNYETILGELETLNLSKYLDEISSLLANCINEKDIQFYSEVATRMNLDYENFPAMLLKDLLKQFSNQYQSPEDNKSRLKALLLFTTELFVIGFPFPYKEITQMLKKLVKAGTKKKTTFTTEKELRLFAYFYNSDIYAAFLKNFGSIFTVSSPKWVSKWSEQGKEVPQYPLMIPAKTRQDFTNAFFTNYITSCQSVLEVAFERIKQLEQQLTNNLKLSGQFNKQVQGNYKELKQKFIFTKFHLIVIIDAMGSQAIVRNYEEDLVDVEEIMKKYINKIENVEIFQNQFERELYLELIQMSKTENKAAGDEEYRVFKEKLDACKNKNESDEVVKAFEGVNNKRTRKFLSKDLLEYRKEYQLVTPFLCRIAATIGQNFKDLTEWLNQFIFAEYEKLRESVTTNFVVNDKKSRNLKYICEFTKFKLVDPEKTIGVIQNLIDDLKGYNIELLIIALESVGRFLYLAPLHANKFTFILSKLENVMKQKSLPLFTISQLINSINLLKPHVEIPKPPAPIQTPTEIQAERLLEKDVIEQIEELMKGITKIIKTSEGLEAVQKYLFKRIQEFDYLGTYHYAYLINEIEVKEITDFIVTHTVQKLEEAVRTGDYQNCLLWSRFFGEQYKYDLVKRTFLFDKLQNFFNQGKGEVGVINLVCTVLETCHGYLDSKRTQSKNQTFLLLVEFKRYIHKCAYVPMLEEFKIIDVFEDLEPNLTSIKMSVLDAFLNEVDVKNNNKEVDLSKALDIYLEKCNLKENKNAVIDDPEDKRNDSTRSREKEEPTEEINSEMLLSEARMFDSEFLNVMNSHIKDLSGRIAKPAFVEKVIEKKRERKKVGEGEQKRTVIGRCGTKFVKKEVVFASKPEEIVTSIKKQQ